MEREAGRMNGGTTTTWVAVSGWVTAVAGWAVAGIAWVTLQHELNKTTEEKAKEPAKLVVLPAADYKPCGPGSPTLLPFCNEGKREGLITQVTLSNWKLIPTPQRQNVAGAGKTIRVAFERRHYV